MESNHTPKKKVKTVTKLAIVGSRHFTDVDLFEEKLEEWLDEYPWPDVIVSGGAKGVDTLAERWAAENLIEVEVFCAQWHDPVTGVRRNDAGLKRNTRIIEACTHVLAFPSRKGRGTQDSIRKAKLYKKPLTVHWVEDLLKKK